MEIRTARKLFFDAKKTEGVTIRTYQTYMGVLKPFSRFLIENDIYDIHDVKPEHIRTYLLEHKEKGVKNITLHRDYRVLKTFFLFLYTEEIVEKNLIKNIKAPKIEKKDARTFTPKEVRIILKSFNKSSYLGMRNYTIVSLMLSTGIRKSEVTQIKMEDVNTISDVLRIHGKGNKERIVPLGVAMSKTLRKYLKSREEFLKRNYRESEYLFVGTQSKNITLAGLAMLHRRIKEKTGLTGERISCHTWRHTFAKNYLLNGGDVFTLQKILGHEDIQTTQLYMNMLVEDVKSQHARFNPLDNTDWML